VQSVAGGAALVVQLPFVLIPGFGVEAGNVVKELGTGSSGAGGRHQRRADLHRRGVPLGEAAGEPAEVDRAGQARDQPTSSGTGPDERPLLDGAVRGDRKSTRLNSSHVKISYAVF